MRVPDESKCNKKKEFLIEDRAGYTLCPQCVSCTLNNYTTIYSDGAFYCFFLKKWKRGDDIIERVVRATPVRHARTVDEETSVKINRTTTNAGVTDT